MHSQEISFVTQDTLVFMLETTSSFTQVQQKQVSSSHLLQTTDRYLQLDVFSNQKCISKPVSKDAGFFVQWTYPHNPQISTFSTYTMWIKNVDEKIKIVTLHNRFFLSKKNYQTFKIGKKVIHIEKCGKTGKNGLINGVIHFIHIKKSETLWFTYVLMKQMFCNIFIKMWNVDRFFKKNVDFCNVKKWENNLKNCQNI